MKCALISNPQKYEVQQVLQQTLAWAQDKEIDCYIAQQTAQSLTIVKSSNLHFCQGDASAIEVSDLLIVIGGDGTMLYAARLARGLEKPILGINSGHLGFMNDVSIEEMYSALDALIEKNYTLDYRYFLESIDQEGNLYYALNEYLFTRRDSSSMINIDAEYDGALINTYWSDGLIVASPTGSTAYILSAGGPIVMPGSGVVVVTPVNPHTLTTRPLVLPSDKELRISIPKSNPPVIFSCDGVLKPISEYPFSIHIKKSTSRIPLVHLTNHSYFDTLRKKLMWGQDSRRT